MIHCTELLVYDAYRIHGNENSLSFFYCNFPLNRKKTFRFKLQFLREVLVEVT